MRRLACAVLVLSACGDSGPNQGAILTFDTPDGAVTATRLEVVLANASPDTIAEVDNQRREPGSSAEDAVRYYRQRALGGVVEGMTTLAGFKLRIEPDVTTSTDESFIPFVFVYNGDALVGIGNVEDELGDPTHVLITPGTLTSYSIVVSPITVRDADEAAVDRGTARVVSCANRQDQASWKSGVAWFPVADPARPNGRAHQLRLLLPDLAKDPAATDATMREDDLDCDQHPASSNDCDDLRGAFYAGAPESCDGLDTNCDSQRFVPQGCAQTNPSCTTLGTSSGVQICDDDEGTLSACTPSAACLCSAGGGTSYCTRCVVEFTGPTASRAACSPSVGKVLLPPTCSNAGCTVEVGGATNAWRAYIGATETASFTTKLSGVHSAVYVEAKRSGMLPQSAGSIGEVYLLVTSAQGGTVTLPIQIEMNSEPNTACPPVPGGNGTSRMICSP
ncbi:hypothetical protein BH11MYX3_BH11MYX3_13360 [soil metagenome]